MRVPTTFTFRPATEADVPLRLGGYFPDPMITALVAALQDGPQVVYPEAPMTQNMLARRFTQWGRQGSTLPHVHVGKMADDGILLSLWGTDEK